MLEAPYAPLPFLVPVLNIFADYKFRIGLYVVCAIPAFVTLITIVGALISLVAAGFYGFCLFKGESGTEIKEGSESSKKKSLASQDTAV